ncbi:hypothetical protein [Mycolicibacterium sarraceniae]|nr:hypothetical protein [Mycolicibacterium sarraceniae]
MGVDLVEVEIAIGVSRRSFSDKQEPDAVWPVSLSGLRTSAALLCDICIDVPGVRTVGQVLLGCF